MKIFAAVAVGMVLLSLVGAVIAATDWWLDMTAEERKLLLWHLPTGTSTSGPMDLAALAGVAAVVSGGAWLVWRHFRRGD
jgi:hypothetical protein